MRIFIFLNIVLIFSIPATAQKSLSGRELPSEISESIVYNEVKDSLIFGDLLNEFTGNVIYVEFWASWCKYCQQGMTHSAQLRESLIDEDVVFLYISTDVNHDSWLECIENYNLSGIHYRLDINSKPQIKEFFRIKAIPYFFIINRHGIIADPDAGEPGKERTRKEILEILNQ